MEGVEIPLRRVGGIIRADWCGERDNLAGGFKYSVI